MPQSPDFKEVQRRIMRMMIFEDGLWDLLLGSIFMLLAAYPVSRQVIGPEWNFVLFLVLLGLFVSAQLILRQVVSRPRIGYVRSRRSPKTLLLLLVVIIFVLLTLGLVLLTLLTPVSGKPIPDLGRSYLVEWIVVFVMGGIFSAMGYIFGVKRIYLYGWMVGVANLVSVYLSHSIGWTFLIPMAFAAGIILIIGLTRFVRFLGNYPINTQEA